MRTHLLVLTALLLAACSPTTEQRYDTDGDGIEDAQDCAPTDPTIYPDNDDPYGDGIDSDCDCDDDDPVTGDGIDEDCDGYPTNPPGGIDSELFDCADDDETVHPGAEVDDCTECIDEDGDGGCDGDGDCDDADPTVYLGAPELSDCIDNDCDGDADEGTDSYDNDGDGLCVGVDLGEGEPACCAAWLPGDCDDADPGANLDDEDGDGYPTCPGPCQESDDECPADCDDDDDGIHPEADEGCDGIDNDCDGEPAADEVDEDGDGDLACSDCDDADPAMNTLDADQDNYGTCAGDCDDDAQTINPEANDFVGDGEDQNCDGADGVDEDGDGAAVDWSGGDDCDDSDPAANQDDIDLDGASTCEGDCDDLNAVLNVQDVDGDGFDTCDGDCDDADPVLNLADADGDLQTSCAGDCDDADPTSWDGAVELCDGIDNDCTAGVPADEADGDLDGFRVCEGDCDDSDPVLNLSDVDLDGQTSCAGDCDDLVAATFDGASEVCDGLDNDCDGVLPADEADGDADGTPQCAGDCDDSDPVLNLVDADADGQTSCAGDCADEDPARQDGGTEICDGVDNDCDETLPADEADPDGDGAMLCAGDCDDSDPALNLSDADGDGVTTCDVDPDCDDALPEVYPGALDVCDTALDNDCDGAPDPLESDGDGDGQTECEGDCDDSLPTVYDGAPDLCDGQADNDCDGVLDPGEVNLDGDGATVCQGDCDDNDPTRYPGQLDTVGDGIDNNCDDIDGVDIDGDGYASTASGGTDCNDTNAAVIPVDVDGDGSSPCSLPADCDEGDPSLNQADADGDGYSTCGGDCNDSTGTVKPGASDFCDAYEDNNCDGNADPMEADADNDGWSLCDGDCDDTDTWSSPDDQDGDGYIGCEDDCDDSNAAINPHGIEVPGSGGDTNCDGLDYCVDLNCDNWTDLVFANFTSGSSYSVSSYIYWGGPSGYSSSNRSSISTTGAWDVELADLDGDGYVDIVFSNYWNGFSTSINSYVYWGSASGYSTGDRTSLPTVGAAGVSVGFMNSDGWLDIVFSNYSNGSGDFTIDSYLYWGSSSGFSSGNKRNFATWGSHRSYVGEITGDCCWDLIFTNHRNDTGNNAMDSFVYHGAGGGPYEANLSTVDTLGASGVDAADVNGDGWYDLAITNYSDAGNFDLDSYIYWGVGPSTWWSSANRSAFPTIGGAQVSFHHIDGDGQIDMLVANHGDGVDYTQNSHLYWGTGGAPSTGQRVSMATVGAWGHAAGDFDEDGDVDIVFANNVDNSGNFQINSYIYWNVGAPTWFTSANRTSLYTRGAKNVAASGPAVEILRSN